jgi:uncharacterized membrane protein
MNAVAAFFATMGLLMLVDMPWLFFIGGAYGDAVQRIQGGRPMVVRFFAALPVYVALAFLVRRMESIKDAFMTGAATYAVYDFTVMTVFKDYPLSLAVGDTVWGGILFAAVYSLNKWLKL